MIDPGQACQLCLGRGACFIKLTIESRCEVTCPACEGSGRLDDAVAKTLAADQEFLGLLSTFSWHIKLQETDPDRPDPEIHPLPGVRPDPYQREPRAGVLRDLLHNLLRFL